MQKKLTAQSLQSNSKTNVSYEPVLLMNHSMWLRNSWIIGLNQFNEHFYLNPSDTESVRAFTDLTFYSLNCKLLHYNKLQNLSFQNIKIFCVITFKTESKHQYILLEKYCYSFKYSFRTIFFNVIIGDIYSETLVCVFVLQRDWNFCLFPQRSVYLH